ncbi:MAG: hypothetical protein IJ514_03190 [Clostridia bacterium]|nr:hypothetical protein [Clostridia bacterium]
MKERYLNVMERALECYSVERLKNYTRKVKDAGLTDQSLSRLAANIGILIAYNRKRELTPVFFEMMDICCEQIPKVKAANEFSVVELCLLLLELERSDFVEKERLQGWKTQLSSACAFDLYKQVYTLPPEKLHNWALFGASSEWLRVYTGMSEERDFVDKQIATQLRLFDENGMYIDPHAPILYDLVARYRLALMLHFGYNGKYRKEMDVLLEKSGLLTLRMQSVTGEIPYGGRSNQFLHNEANLVVLYKFEALRYKKRGELEKAGQFVRAANLALEAIEKWLEFVPSKHVKNRYSQDSFFGCEGYAYFDKYMITLASVIYPALFLDTSSIAEVACPAECGGFISKTGDAFHKVFLNKNGYFLEADTCADLHYEGSGLGRIHKANAPSAICLSMPFAKEPWYKLGERKNETDFSICPAIKTDKERWIFGAGNEASYTFVDEKATSRMRFVCDFGDNKTVNFICSVDKDGVLLQATSENQEELGICLPVFSFDGETSTKISENNEKLSVEYEGWVCEYQTENLTDLRMELLNRNGVYKGYIASGKKAVEVRIRIKRAKE